MRVCIVGLGLIGGSLARALQRGGHTPTAIDADDSTVAAARRDGIRAERADDPGRREALPGAEVVVIAVPIERMSRVSSDILGHVDAGASLLHAGSLQRREALTLSDANAARIIGTHPMAGTHAAGYEASRYDLFDGATVSIESRADASARSVAESLWRAAGASRFVYRSADEHDALMAWTSHLPQLVSTALASVLARASIDRRDAGPGARDTTRLAGSPYAMWKTILDSAHPDTLRAIDAMHGAVGEIRAAMAAGDDAALENLWTRGGQWVSGSLPNQ